jgi:mono/diheme cytochrome c family protein
MNARLSSLLFVTAVAVTVTLHACCRDTAQPGDPVRGRYLVEQVGLCSDCHSPRNERGEFVAERWLEGSALPFQPTVPMPWAPAAPRIKGLPSLSDEQAVHFLVHGELPGGRLPRPPMPPFRFAPQDARDVVAYLRAPINPAPAATSSPAAGR